MPAEKELYERIRRIQEGGAQKYHEANEKKGKLFVRDRLKLLLDEGLDLEDAFFCQLHGRRASGRRSRHGNRKNRRPNRLRHG